MKKILIGSAIALTTFTVNKAKKTKQIINSLKVKITKLRVGSLALSMIKLSLDLTITNESSHDLGLTTFKLLKIKEIRFFNRKNNQFLATAFVDVHDLKINANDSLTLYNIPVELETKNVFENLSIFKGDLQENIKIVLILDTMGKQYELNTENFIS
ncbi:hypothetical protein BTO06_04085 [Tenacibaculum sp. SZ-18]|uniref:hypothetical protein n=1 Tax=Tenacibaculum sp. SZ-18 TaxID=754423 RepID=UPI000C2D2382|nr:hypothetical protein [Tenacibaculum sp. SZ-18]AUC14372.1 hypothetical protein BTO06_04085 [Tenacibaculum sp. SZ-18]